MIKTNNIKSEHRHSISRIVAVPSHSEQPSFELIGNLLLQKVLKIFAVPFRSEMRKQVKIDEAWSVPFEEFIIFQV